MENAQQDNKIYIEQIQQAVSMLSEIDNHHTRQYVINILGEIIRRCDNEVRLQQYLHSLTQGFDNI